MTPLDTVIRDLARSVKLLGDAAVELEARLARIETLVLRSELVSWHVPAEDA